MELELINSLQGNNIKKICIFLEFFGYHTECLLMLLYAFHKKKTLNTDKFSRKFLNTIHTNIYYSSEIFKVKFLLPFYHDHFN